MGCYFLLQGIFLTQKSNLHLLHCRWILYHWVTGEAPYQSYSLLRPISIILSFLWSLSRLPYAHLNTFFLNIPTKHFHDLFFLAALHAGFQFPDLANPRLLQWKHGVLTTGRPGSSSRLLVSELPLIFTILMFRVTCLVHYKPSVKLKSESMNEWVIDSVSEWTNLSSKMINLWRQVECHIYFSLNPVQCFVPMRYSKNIYWLNKFIKTIIL